MVHTRGIIGIIGNEKECGNCSHFMQHYVITSENRLLAINAGHCKHPRLKNRFVHETCQYFEQGREALYLRKR